MGMYPVLLTMEFEQQHRELHVRGSNNEMIMLAAILAGEQVPLPMRLQA
jgi:hypothetical protein